MSWIEITTGQDATNLQNLNSYISVISTSEPTITPQAQQLQFYIGNRGAHLFYYADGIHQFSLGFKTFPTSDGYRVNVGYVGPDPLAGLKIGITQTRLFMDSNNLLYLRAERPKVVANVTTNTLLDLIPQIMWEWTLYQDIPQFSIWKFYRNPARHNEDLLWIGPLAGVVTPP